MNQIVFLILCLTALIWWGSSVQTHKAENGPVAGDAAMCETSAILAYGTRGGAQSIEFQFDALHPVLLAALQLLVAVGALLAATPSTWRAVIRGSTKRS